MDQGKNMEEKVFSYIEQYRMIEAGDQVIVGVSGGADSVCLLFLLWEYQKKVPFSVQAVHVNHQLRGSEAKRDEEYVVRLCRELSIPCSVYSYEVERIAGKRHMTVEEAGRAVRQQAFSLEGKKAGAKSTLPGWRTAPTKSCPIPEIKSGKESCRSLRKSIPGQ